MLRLRRDSLVTASPTPRPDRAGRRGQDKPPPQTLLQKPGSAEVFAFGPEEMFLLQALERFPDADAAREAFAETFGQTLSAADHAAFLAEVQAMGLLEEVEPDRLAEVPSSPDGGVAPVGLAAGSGRADPAAFSPAAAEDDPDWDLSPAPGQATDPEDDPADLLGLIEAGRSGEGTAPPAAAGSGQPKRRGRPSAVTLFNPNRMLGGLATLFRPLRFLVWPVLLGLVPLAGLSLARHWGEFLGDLVRAFAPLSLILNILIGLFLVNLTSKLAQGTVCRGFGGDMHQFGIRLAFGLLPRFFLDKGQIRRLSRRGQLWSYAAPLIAKLTLFAGGILGWVLLRRDGSDLALALLVLSQMGLGSFLFTANPLWRADGYLFLSTLFDQPRLRDNALTLLRLWLTVKPAPAALSAGQRWALLSFALAVVLFTTLLIGGVLITLAQALEAEFQGLGVVLFLVILALFASWLYAMRRGRTPTRAMAKDLPRMTPTAAARRARWLRRVAGLAGVAGLAWVAVQPYPYETGGDVTLEPIARTEARAGVGGSLMQVVVREGDWVEADAVLAVLDDRDARHRLAVARASLDEARADLARLEEGATPEQIARAEAGVDTAAVAVRYARQDLERAQALQASGVIAPARLDQYAGAVATAEARLAEAQANLAAVKEPPRQSELDAAAARIRRLDEEVRFRETDLDRTRLRAPAAGRVVTDGTSLPGVGAYLPEGALFALIEDTRRLQATIAVPETDILDVALGDPARFKLWGQDGAARPGTVVAIAPVAQEQEFGRIVRVTTELPNPDGTLRSGMTGYGKIAVGEKPVWQAFGRLLIRFVTIEMWSWIP